MLAFISKLKPLSSQPNELKHLDFLRVIACYAIIFDHFSLGAEGKFKSVLNHFHHCFFTVDVFFIMSGFIISFVYETRLNTTSELSTFFLRRFARLAPLHWLTLLFYVALGLMALAGFHTNLLTNYDWSCLVPNALGLQAFGICKALSFNYVNWSISAEVGMYLIAPALLWFGRRSRYWPLLMSIAFLSILFLFSSSFAEPWYQWSWDFGVIRALPDFTMGVALFFFRAQVGRIPAPRVFLFLAVAGFIVGCALEWPNPILLVFAYLTAVAAIACDTRPSRQDWISTISILGQLTYSMYLLHPVMITLLMNIVGQHMLHLHGIWMNCWIILVISLIAPVSYLSLQLFETPARLWISGSKRRRRVSQEQNIPMPLAVTVDA